MSWRFPQRSARVRSWFAKGSTLFMTSLLEIGTPFARMIILARFLSLAELGFASALTATYGIFETTTDLAVHRFVFRAPPDEFDDALASAHALMILRGLIICVVAVAAAPLIASLFSVGPEWKIFAALGLLALVRSFENLGPRVAERNYQFSPQLKMNLASTALGLAALVATLYLRRDHTAIVMCQLGQNVGYVVASHVVSNERYRIKFRSPQFIRAFRFGYPLMVNGFGIAIAGQGDRFVVGSLLGLQALGLYNVVLMVTVVPITMVFRLMGTTNMARFYNASPSAKLLEQRVRLAGELSPLVATDLRAWRRRPDERRHASGIWRPVRDRADGDFASCSSRIRQDHPDRALHLLAASPTADQAVGGEQLGGAIRPRFFLSFHRSSSHD